MYFDYAATTPLDPRVIEVMHSNLMTITGNAASTHQYGRHALAVIEWARLQVASAIDALPDEIIWTSGATESNNLALKGAMQLYQQRGKHLITMQTEHKSVLDSCQHLEKNGYQVTYLPPMQNGLLDLQLLADTITPKTALVSIMHVNNETGVTQHMTEIAEIVKKQNCLLHIDAAQSIGKLPFSVQKIPADFVSLSAHKVYGPKGIGALYCRKKPRVRVAPQMHGGGHEQGLRSGTLPTHQIVGMGEAFELATTAHEIDMQALMVALSPLEKFSHRRVGINTVPHIWSLQFPGMLADALHKELEPIAASSASACLGTQAHASYVLHAMGFKTEVIQSTLRFSFGRFTTADDIGQLSEALGSLIR